MTMVLTEDEAKLIQNIYDLKYYIKLNIKYLYGYYINDSGYPDKSHGSLSTTVDYIESLNEIVNGCTDIKKLENIENKRHTGSYNWSKGAICFNKKPYHYNSIDEYLEVVKDQLKEWLNRDVGAQIGDATWHLNSVKIGRNPYNTVVSSEDIKYLLKGDIDCLKPDKFKFTRGYRYETIKNLRKAMPSLKPNLKIIRKQLDSNYNKLSKEYNEYISSNS